MTLFKQICEVYPELTNTDFDPKGVIGLQNDADGQGDYIVRWDYEKPIPEGLKLGK